MSSDNGDALERWLRPLPFGVFFALALFACFPQVLLGFESFFARDYGVLGYPNIHFQRDCFWRGELPMWNPYSNCGQPFLAQWGTMTLYPLSLIYLLLPLPWSLSLFCFAHVWLGGFGMYLLARSWTNTNSGGALAGTVFVFNGIMFASFAWPNYLVTLGWMPFVVLLAARAWREGGRWMVGASLVAALQMLSGAPEVILFTWIIVGALGLCDAARARGARLTMLRRTAGVALLTAALTAVQLVPFFELLQWSQRGPEFATSKWQLPLWGWANFFVPLYNAIETPSGQYFQHDQGFLTSVYLGGVAAVFALVALLRWPDARVWVLTALAAVGVVFAFGDNTPVMGAVKKIAPFLGVARYPVKFLFLLAFVLPLLAGCGLAAVVKSRQRGAVWASALLVLALVFAILWVARGDRFVDYSAWPEVARANVHFSWNKNSPGKSLPDAVGNTALRVLLSGAALACLLAALRPRKISPVFALAGFAFIAADVSSHTPLQNPSIPSALFTGRAWSDDSLARQPGEARVLITPQADNFLSFLSNTNLQLVWNIKRRAEWSNLNLLDGVAKVNGSSTLQTREQRLVEQALYLMTNRLPAGLLDFLGVSWTTSSNSAAEWAPRSTALPLVTAGQELIFADETVALTLLTNRTFDPRRVVILPPEARNALANSNGASAAVSSVTLTTHSVEAQIDAPAPTLMVIAQSYYPTWQATVDGVRVPLLRANVAFQAVPVPAGPHRVRVIYSDAKFRACAGVSGAALLLCLLLWLRVGKSRPV